MSNNNFKNHAPNIILKFTKTYLQVNVNSKQRGLHPIIANEVQVKPTSLSKVSLQVNVNSKQGGLQTVIFKFKYMYFHCPIKSLQVITTQNKIASILYMTTSYVQVPSNSNVQQS